GGFALYWSEGGANYGIPARIKRDLAAGRSVIVTVPRIVVEAAKACFPHVQVIEIGGPQGSRLRSPMRPIQPRKDGPDNNLAEFDAALARFPRVDLRGDKLPA